MKLLMTADTVGGVWSYASQLGQALRAKGWEVALATMGAPLRPSQHQDSEGLTIFESSFKLEWMQDPWDDVAAAGDWLLDVERRFQPDIVHLNSYAHGALQWSAPVLMTAHSCVYSWWNAVHSSEPPDTWERYYNAVHDGLRNASSVTAVSRFMAAEIGRIYHFGDARVVSNGADASLYRPGEKQPYIFASGRVWDKAKNLQMLEALSVPWPICVAGECNHPDGGQVQLRGCKTLGRLDPNQMKEWYSRAAIYVSPARYEPFGLSVLEAALSGCALVLNDIASFRELWSGAAVFASEPDEFAWELRALAADRERRQEYAMRARQKALRYNLEAMVQQYEQLYLSQAGVACGS